MNDEKKCIIICEDIITFPNPERFLNKIISMMYKETGGGVPKNRLLPGINDYQNRFNIKYFEIIEDDEGKLKSADLEKVIWNLARDFCIKFEGDNVKSTSWGELKASYHNFMKEEKEEILKLFGY